MRKELFVIFLSLILVLAACSQKTEIKPEVQPQLPAQQEAKQPTQQQAAPQTTEQPKTAEPPKPVYDANSLTAKAASAEEAAKLILQKAKGDKTSIDANIKTASVGDTVVFGIGIQNTLPQTTKFVVETTFIEAQFKMGTNFDYTKPAISKWLDNHFQTSYELKTGEILTVPSYIVVGDKVSDETQTQPATYVFETAIYTLDSHNYKTPFEKQRMSVKVQ